MKLGRLLLTSAAGSTLAYGSWLAFRPLTIEEKNNWNAIYIEDPSIMLRVYRRAPLNLISRLWGRLHHLDLPESMRRPVCSCWSAWFNCNLSEAANADLSAYKNLSEFFRRELRPDARPIDSRADLVAPADGRVLHLGLVAPDARLQQVKGVDYTLQGFFGPLPSQPDTSPPVRLPDGDYYSQLKTKSSTDTNLYHCVIYLAPGDYHRFHSPANWQVVKRRHFPGCLMSVSPYVAGFVRGLFCLNERAVYTGYWRHGFFSYAAIGATLVGSIRVHPDPDLVTNQSKPMTQPYRDLDFSTKSALSPSHADGLTLTKGQLFGEFDLGSTIVLVFEAPADFQFTVEPGQRVQVGQRLAQLQDS